MVKYILIIFLYFIPSSYSEIIDSAGEAYISPDGDLNSCRNDAKDKAYREALEKVVGESIVSNQDLQCKGDKEDAFCDFRKRTISNIEGIVKPVKDHNFTTISEGNLIKCEWTQQVNVEKLKYYPDFEFRFSLSENKFIAPVAPEDGIKLNDNKFKDISFNFEPKQESYLYIFQNSEYINKGKSFFKIFPNKLDVNNRFSKSVNIPTKDNYKFKISFPSGLYDDVYYVTIIAIASEKEISFYDEYTFEDFQTKLFEIMNQKYRYKSEFYSVLKKD